MRTVEMDGLGRLPVIGQGTWGFGERPQQRTQEIEALRLGFSLGMTLVDTAEIYGIGGAEEVVAEAIHDCRAQIFLVTKVWPSRAAPNDLRQALEASLRRLRTDYTDLVLLHWPTRGVPLGEILRGLRAVQRDGLARHIGVSNFDLPWLERLRSFEERPGELRCNEIPYSLADRRAERGVIAEAQTQGRLVLAYSPLAHGRAGAYAEREGIRRVAAARGISPQEAALAWVVRHRGVVAIPKAVSRRHVEANARAGDLALSAEEIALLSRDGPAEVRDLHPGLPPYGWFHRLAFGAMRLQRDLRRGS